MKSDNKALWRLIRTIAVVELEWLKRWAQKNQFKGDQIYLELLDFIWNIKTYSEEKLRERFPEGDLARRKYYLFQFLIDGLTVLKREGDTLPGYKAKAETCFERGAWEKALNFIEKALAKALETEEYGAAIDILKLNDKVLPFVFMGGKLLEKVKTNVAEIKRLWSFKKELEKIELLESTDYSLFRTSLKNDTLTDKEVNEYAGNFDSKPEFRTQKAEFLWYRLQLPIFWYSRNWKELEVASTKMFAVLLENEWLQRAYPEEFYHSLMQTVISELHAGNHEKAKSLFKRFEKAKFDTPLSYKFLQYKLLAMFVMEEEGVKGIGAKAVKLIEDNEDKLEDYFDTHMLHLIWLSQTEWYFNNGQFEKGTRVVAWVLNRHKARPEIEIQAKVYHLIGMYETKDMHGIDMLSGKYSRSSKKLPFYPISKEIIDFIRKTPKYRSKWKVEREINRVLALIGEHREEKEYHNFFKRSFLIEEWVRNFLKGPGPQDRQPQP